MPERKINMLDAAIFRVQAMLESSIRLQCEIISHLSNQPFEGISEAVWKEIQRDTKELIEAHSKLSDDPTQN